MTTKRGEKLLKSELRNGEPVRILERDGGSPGISLPSCQEPPQAESKDEGEEYDDTEVDINASGGE